MASKVGTTRAKFTVHAHKEPKVTEDLVRYMKAASENNNTFLTDDPIWAEDFAPNGELTHSAKLGVLLLTPVPGTLLQLGDTITRRRYAE
jgi:gamma-glutamyltranspeptidase/glutathione hydrolase